MKLTITNQFQAFLRQIGADMPILLQKAEIPNKLWQETINLTSIEYYRLLQVFDEVMSEESIRQLSQIKSIQMFIPSFFVALASSHGMEAIERFARFKKIVGPIELDIVEADTTISITYRYYHREMVLPKFVVLNEQLLLLNILRMGTGEQIIPLIVESPFTYEDETLAEFGTTVQESEANRLVFEKKHLKTAFLTQNNIMWHYLEPELNQQLAKQDLEKSFAGYVQQELYSAIPSGAFLAEDIAQRLGVSIRTLQRHLTAEKTNFKKELQTVQKTLAFSYLKMGLTIDEIAELIGYSEANAFSRAFKNWTDMTVSEWRKQMITLEKGENSGQINSDKSP